jgi:hypothetical protein
MIEPKGRGVLDTPLEPVIGLAEGETRWRGTTAADGGWALSSVIASEAKQSISPREGRMDCVASRAMTNNPLRIRA